MQNKIASIILKNRILILVSLAIMLSGFTSGVVSYGRIQRHIDALIGQAYSGIFSQNVFETMMNILLRNIWSSALLTILGITIVLSVGVLFVNGFMVAIVVRYAHSKGMGLFKILAGIMPHGIFEVPALLLASAIGLRIGLSLVKPGPEGRLKKVAESMREASLVYLLVVLPLLIVAAVVETLISKNLIMI